MVVCCAFWGGNAVAVKFATPELPPFAIAGFRFLLSLPVLAIVCRLVGQPLWVKPEHWRLLLGHALITVAQIGSSTGAEAIPRRVDRRSSSTSTPDRRASGLGDPRRTAGLAMRRGLSSAAVGVALVLSTSFGGTDPNLSGDLVVLASGAIFAAQTIWQKLTFSRIPPATLLFNQSVVAVPLFFLYSGLFEGFATYRFTPTVVLAVVYQGIAVSGFCFSIWLLLLGRYPASQLATVAFVTPMFGVGLGRWLKHDDLSPSLVLGGLLVGLGIYLTASDRAEHLPPDDVELPGEDAP